MQPMGSFREVSEQQPTTSDLLCLVGAAPSRSGASPTATGSATGGVSVATRVAMGLCGWWLQQTKKWEDESFLAEVRDWLKRSKTPDQKSSACV